MEWTRLLSARRFGSAKASRDASESSPFLVDLDRIVFSSPFRRLQDKTQVHPLSPEQHVRTRLTHSIEVASVGRSLGFEVGSDVVPRAGLSGVSAHDFGYIVQAACLTHDIGNPPFGHAGESAIGHWFRDNDWVFDEAMTEAQKADLWNFEGNAQGFRILNRLEMYKDDGGLRLTHATLGAFTKYPRGALVPEGLKGRHAGVKKPGFFQAEAPRFQEIAEDLGLVRRQDGVELWCRHPFAYLTEAADDICYSVADLEDGVAVGCLSFAEVEERLAPIARAPWKYEGKDAAARTAELRASDWYGGKTDEEKMGFLRGKAISNLVQATVKAFLDNEEAILAGAFEGDLIKAGAFAAEVKACKTIADERIFSSRRKLEVEIAGFDMLGGLLSAFCTAIVDREKLAAGELDEDRLPPKSERLLKLIPDLTREGSRYETLLRVTDFVSGLTDNNAVNLYRKIKGISL